MQLAWSSLGIAVSDFGGAGGAAAALRVDPVDALRLGAGPLRRLRSSSARRQRLSPPPPRRLAGGGALSSASGAVAACAIATTILGTGRALATWCQDALAHQAHVAARAAAWSFRTLFELAYRSRTRPALLPPIKALSAGRHFLDTSYALPRHFLDASLGLASAANDAASAQSAVGFPRGDALISRRAARRPRESLGGLHGRQRSFRRGSATWAAPRRALAVEPYSGGRQMRGSGVGGGASPAHGTHTRVSGVRPHSLTFHLSFELDEITRGVPCHQEMKILKDIV